MDNCGESGGGGYQEGFHGEGEASKSVEAGIGAIDDCAALGNMSVVCTLEGILIASKDTLVL